MDARVVEHVGLFLPFVLARQVGREVVLADAQEARRVEEDLPPEPAVRDEPLARRQGAVLRRRDLLGERVGLALTEARHVLQQVRVVRAPDSLVEVDADSVRHLD